MILPKIREVCAKFPHREVTLFGHSLGASVAYEVMRILESSEGPAPIRLIASSRGTPDENRNLGIHLLSDDELIAEVDFLSGTATSILKDPEMMEMFLPVIRNDYAAAENYLGSLEPLHADITAISGKSDPRILTSDVSGWSRFTIGNFDIRMIEGGHFDFTYNLSAFSALMESILGIKTHTVPSHKLQDHILETD